MFSDDSLGGSPMNYAEARKECAKHYKQVAAQTDLHVASPYKIIQLLLQGALDRLSSAKSMHQSGDYGKMGSEISVAISIIDNLRVSLDHSINPELTEPLEALYDYMTSTLLKANIEKSEEKLNEVAKLIIEIKSGWDAIPPEHQNAHEHPEDYFK